ncbi:glycyl-tRNA synthetase, beta subunit [Solidesulfovibrio carbinoliphilus subsp. oakridgensis]|uniref:Glycine--tRNA ligase beta subunit n=1 Tax=Solidesulfovibrio carbinoliphilus subsp. oakridgensis TaxID=694327 RepID=G7Q3V7_9BACT|nr:glycine--tRNA ligase subunit beta [Solidesulfovibrio carbinoliphilus]EHJ46747.1 glycyl-tRNA synthetase, beta subunit [Solidesulfovibrio carbinoliphilus subsp. oakridgensis]
MSHFLFEIGFEEMPARFLSGLASEVRTLFTDALAQAKLDASAVTAFATPRRLVVSIPELAADSRREEELVTGPPERVGFDASGNPTPAAVGFAKGQGKDVADVFVMETGKGRYLALNKTTGGEPAMALLPGMCLEAVKKLSFPKRMRWGSRDFAFGRPVHWFLALLGDAVVPFELDGIVSGRRTRGHRIMGPGPFDVAAAKDYFGIIRDQGKVVLDARERESLVRSQAETLAREAGGTAVINPALLAEVTGLTEHPVVLLGRLDPKFLDVPREVLITSMETHQKSFAVEDGKGGLLPVFLTTLGLVPGNVDLVRRGWQRVLTARLEDARFFWEADLATDLETWQKKLESVVFLAGLGSMRDKARRLERLCGVVAEQAGKPEVMLEASQAGGLAKVDLVSDMVGEFAELQGIMGGIYVRRKGQSKTVSRAIAEQYLPAGPDSPVPATLAGAVLSLADKADTLAGCFGLDMAPTGAADPYALRRAALGICRIVIEHGLRLNLMELLQAALDGYGEVKFKVDRTHILARLLDFFGQRLKAYFTGRGFDTLVVEAAAGASFTDIAELAARIPALAAFAAKPDFGQAVLTFKRAANIIRKQGVGAGQPLTGLVKAALLEEQAEKDLAAVCADVFPRYDALFEAGDYAGVLDLLYELRPTVDAFFDNVMVMCDDMDVRLNRLNLLKSLVDRLGRVADFAALQV